MWVIRLRDGTSHLIYLRDCILDGSILYFDHEETALRFLQEVGNHLYTHLDVTPTVIRWEGDRRKETFCKVTLNNMSTFAETILQFLKD